MVLCFSATGNSRLAAQVLAGKLGDELVSLNEVFKARKEWAFRSEAPYVLVAPIYAWRLPKQVEAFLKRARLLGNRQIYVLATMALSCRTTIWCPTPCQAGKRRPLSSNPPFLFWRRPRQPFRGGSPFLTGSTAPWVVCYPDR